jgi:hypothetical protein
VLIGIDVVIIEPGTVNTAMYDKGEKEDLSEFKQTEYWEAVQRSSRSSSSPKHVLTAYPLSVCLRLPVSFGSSISVHP